MAKKQQALVLLTVGFGLNTPAYDYLEGTVVSVDASVLVLEHKRPRSSKMMRTGIKVSDLISVTGGIEVGAEVGVYYKTSSVELGAVTGVVEGADGNFLTVTDEEGNVTTLAASSVMYITGDSDAEAPAKAKPAAAEKPAAKAKAKPAAADEDDEGDDEGEEGGEDYVPEVDAYVNLVNEDEDIDVSGTVTKITSKFIYIDDEKYALEGATIEAATPPKASKAKAKPAAAEKPAAKAGKAKPAAADEDGGDDWE